MIDFFYKLKYQLRHIGSKLNPGDESHFNSILSGSALNAIAKILAVAMGFVSSLLISNFYGPQALGIIATITSLVALLGVVAVLGNDTLCVQKIPRMLSNADSHLIGVMIVKVSFISLLLSIAVIASYLFFQKTFITDNNQYLVEYQVLIAVFLLITVLGKILKFSIRGFGDYRLFSILEILPSSAGLLFVILAVIATVEETTLVYLYFLQFLCSLILGAYFLRRLLYKNNKLEKHVDSTIVKSPKVLSLLALSIPMFGTAIGTTVLSSSDVVILGQFRSSESVGVYSIYIKIVSVVAIVINSINAMFATKCSLLYHEKKIDELRVLSKKTTLLTLIISSLFVIAILIIHFPVLMVFGEEFVQDLLPFYLILVGALVNALFGSTGYFLNMTDSHRVFFIIMSTAAALNVGLNYLLIPSMGMTGAALATLISISFWNVAATLVIKRKFGYTLLYTGRG